MKCFSYLRLYFLIIHIGINNNIFLEETILGIQKYCKFESIWQYNFSIVLKNSGVSSTQCMVSEISIIVTRQYLLGTLLLPCLHCCWLHCFWLDNIQGWSINIPANSMSNLTIVGRYDSWLIEVHFLFNYYNIMLNKCFNGSPFYRWSNWGLEMWSVMIKVKNYNKGNLYIIINPLTWELRLNLSIIHISHSLPLHS